MEKIENFILPTLKYLKFGNIFSGSLNEFNYKIFPNIEENFVRVVIWKGKYCFLKSEILFEEKFIFEDNLIEKINIWLLEKHNNL